MGNEAAIHAINQVIAGGPFSADWPSLQGFRVPSWYEEGKFGIFVHWGVYAVPGFGSEWYPRNMYAEAADVLARPGLDNQMRRSYIGRSTASGRKAC